MSQCKNCKKEIHWVKTMSGANMPINPDPKIDHLFRHNGEVLFDPSRMVSHFSTCPAAAQFRKKGEVGINAVIFLCFVTVWIFAGLIFQHAEGTPELEPITMYLYDGDEWILRCKNYDSLLDIVHGEHGELIATCRPPVSGEPGPPPLDPNCWMSIDIGTGKRSIVCEEVPIG